MVSIVERFIGMERPDPRAGILGIAETMLQWRVAEKDRLDKIHDYWIGEQPHPTPPQGVPPDLVRRARFSRVNLLDIVISAVSQTLYVEGFREQGQEIDDAAWSIWQANKLDAEQSGIYDAALAYGASYVTVLPGDPVPVIKGWSPRFMTAVYRSDDTDWPMFALGAEPGASMWTYWLYDHNSVHTLEANANGGGLQLIESRRHNLGVVPVVRFRDRIDLDGENRGQIEPLMDLQDQIDDTTLDLKVAEHYGAFKQRAVMGWMAENEEQALKASAQRVWTFEDPDVKAFEFSETNLDGYLSSRDTAIRYLSVIAQTPPHYLLGQLVNLSAEALVASEASLMRKARQRQKSFGESWEQTLMLAGKIAGFEVSPNAQVRWADTESRALSATVDALMKLKTLGVPLELLLEKIPNFTQQDVEKAKALLVEGDTLGQLAALLNRQADEPELPDVPEDAA